VFVRKAGAIVPRDMVGNWLHGVALRTALEARKMNAKRRAKESQMLDVPREEAAGNDTWDEMLALLDQELNCLPDKYRVPIVLCDLAGKTHKEAARQLGCPQGTLSSRLVRARVLLARRLARHGLAFSGGSLAVLLSRHAQAGVPADLFRSTLKA